MWLTPDKCSITAIQNPEVASELRPDLTKETIGHSANSVTFDTLPKYKRVLLLQGPVGGFFQKLSDHWIGRGSQVIKVNFNPGDDFFYKGNAIQYRQSLHQWPEFLKNLLTKHEIDAVFLFGDCRPIHKPAKALCDSLLIDLWCFEEGYFRPNYFTLEKSGVNYYSSLTHTNPASLLPAESKHPLINYPKRFSQMLWAGFWYWFTNVTQNSKYPYYTHHRELNFQKAVWWTRSFLRLLKYKVTERHLRTLIKSSEPNSYFLVPLQVHDDSQITEHSDYESFEEFIEEVLISFATYIKHNDLGTEVKDKIIIKHHPMNRGHVHYGSFIQSLSVELGISDRVLYLHDLALPEIFPHCKGCITVNSTFGLQSLLHNTPVITLGRCFFDKPELTFQGQLDDFWKDPGTVNQEIFNNYKAHVIATTQVNGCLYSKEYEIT